MASTINASTTGGGGIISTADASGTLALQSAGTTRAQADSTGFGFPGSSSGTTYISASATASGTLTLPAVTSTVSTAATVVGQAIGSVNKLRNGNFIAWPNGTSGSVTTSATGYTSITASAWAAIATGATITWSQVASGGNGAAQSLTLTGNTSVTDITLGQRIESYDAAPLAGQTCTFQLRVTNNTGGSITPTLATRYAGSTDVWTSPVADLAATNLQSIASGATAILSYTFAVSANAINGYELKIDFGNNFSTNAKSVTVTAADFRATPNVAMGLNSSPSAPEYIPTSMQLRWCERFMQATYANGVAPGTSTRLGMVGGYTNVSGTYFGFPVYYRTEMRASPTVYYWNDAGSQNQSSQYNAGSWVSSGASSTVTFVTTGTTAYIAYETNNNACQLWHHLLYADFW